MSQPQPSSAGLRIFATVWAGQVVSIFGSNLTSFATGVWIYQTTGSAAKFSLVTLCLTLPGLLITPLAGALVDRWDRRWSMLLGDGCDALLRFPLLYMVATGQLALWHIYVFVGLSSFFHAFQVPAFAASTALLVPKRHLGRANGWVQAGTSAAQILSPLSAGFLLGAIGLAGIVVIDLVTVSLAVATLLSVRLPRPVASDDRAERRSLVQSVVEGWRYIRERPGFLRLLALTGSINFCFGVVYVLLTPLVLSFATSRELGIVLGCAGVGILTGSLVMGAWGGPEQRVRGVLCFVLAQSVVLAAGVLRPHIVLLTAGAFTYMFFNPLILGCTRALFQTKVAPEVQGRVFSLSSVVGASSLPLAAIIAGPLADRFFEPWMAPGGRLAASVGLLMGVGKGRGIALLCLLASVLMAVFVLLAYRSRPLRNLEREIPDAIPDEEPGLTLPQGSTSS